MVDVIRLLTTERYLLVRQFAATPVRLIGLRSLCGDLDCVSWYMRTHSYRHVLILDDRSAILIKDMFLSELAEGRRV